jgi:aromatic ring-cleaving dioxygenase
MATDDSTSINFRDPFTTLKGGYDIHVYFDMNQHALAVAIYEAFLSYLTLHEIRPTFSFIYDKSPDFEGGPHKGPMWVVQLMGINPARDVIQEGGNDKAVQQLGVAVAWLMLNRHGLKVLVHPNVAMPFGEVELEKIDHAEHALWILYRMCWT